VLIILGCVVYQYFKGSLVGSLTTLMIVVLGSIVSFGYFEFLSDFLFVGRGVGGRFPSLMPWAQMLSFSLLFVLIFAVFQTGVSRLISKNINLGLWPERVGRVCCGVLLGLMLSGLLLTALAMGPLSSKYPYQRFDSASPDVAKPNRALLNADGFLTGWFSLVSRGGMSGENSFAALHPNFLDQLYLNRLASDREVSIITVPELIEVPREQAVWLAPEGLQDTEGKVAAAKSGCNLTIVRVGIRMGKLRQDSGRFTLSQVRLICKRKDEAKKPFAGKGINVYPIGYLKAPELLEIKRLSEPIEAGRDNITAGQALMDFAFEVPENFVPVLVEFKQNNVAQVPAMMPAERRPAEEPSAPPSEEAAPSR
jgi:hypothetical protein